MENERRHGVLAVNKKIFVAAPALAVAISFGNAHLLSQGHEISEIEPIAQSSFKTLVIEDNDYLDKEQKLSHSNLHFTVEPSSSTPMATDVFKSSPVEKK